MCLLDPGCRELDDLHECERDHYDYDPCLHSTFFLKSEIILYSDV